jgi:acetyltransferase-like isoleucine patch superfamily enzyme
VTVADWMTRLRLAVSERQLQLTLTEPPLGDLVTSALPGIKVEGKDTVMLAPDFSGFGALTRIDIDSMSSVVWLAPGTTFGNVLIQMRGRNNIVYIGPNCRLRKMNLMIKGTNNIVAIGQDTSIEDANIHCGPSGCAVMVGDDGMISSTVVIRTSDGHGIFDADTRELINKPQDVTIHRHVWLGNGVRLNKGSVIGAGTVIGQMAVVSGRKEGGSIYAGVPARKIRGNIVWSRTDRFEDAPVLTEPG